MLARREYSSGELAAALTSKGYTPDAAAGAIAALLGERLLDDHRYAESLVRVLTGRGQGPVRIRQALAQSLLEESLIEAALEGGPDFGQLAAEVRRRKFGAGVPGEWVERARQMRFLQYRGFSKDHIASALGRSGADDLPDALTETDP